MIGYKAAYAYRAGQKEPVFAVVTLEIPEDALTNLDRAVVVCRDTAKFRCNKAKTLRVHDPVTGEEFRAAASAWDNRQTNYIVGQTLFVSNYDIRPDVVCATGIHFFLTEEPARYYLHHTKMKTVPEMVKKLETSKFYHENGVLHMEIYTTGTERHVLTYVEDGSKMSHVVFEAPFDGVGKTLFPEPKPAPAPPAPKPAVMKSQFEHLNDMPCCTIC